MWPALQVLCGYLRDLCVLLPIALAHHRDHRDSAENEEKIPLDFKTDPLTRQVVRFAVIFGI
jgi:hypothetical protein